jgi:hypothetical protein
MDIKTVLASSHPDMAKLPGGWEISSKKKFDNVIRGHKEDILKNVFVIRDCFSTEECDYLIKLFRDSHIESPVSVQGRKDQKDDRVGSVRATGWSTHLALQFWKKMKPFFDFRQMEDTTATDWWHVSENLISFPEKCRNWSPVGLSPMLRFMKYQTNGQHYAHYDAGYIYPNPNFRTLMSVVVYLTTNPGSGSTRFIEDGQDHLPIWEREVEDWTREVEPAEIKASISPTKGSVLVFDHRLCHDVEKFEGPEDRIIIRGDVLFESKKS